MCSTRHGDEMKRKVRVVDCGMLERKGVRPIITGSWYMSAESGNAVKASPRW